MAWAVKTDDAPEIIEILDDESVGISSSGLAPAVHDAGGPRWIAPVATVALVALIAYGVASSSSTHRRAEVAPVTSTSIAVTPTTRPAPRTTVPKPPVAHYAADIPTGWELESAETYSNSETLADFYGYQLWATEGSTATSGAWFLISTYGSAPIYAVDAYRLLVGERSVAISRLDGGYSNTMFSISASTTETVGITITSFGLGDDTLSALAGSIEAVRGHLRFTDPSLIAGYDLLSTVPPWWAIQGSALEHVYYLNTADPVTSVNINVAPRASLSDTATGALGDRQIAMRFLLAHTTSFAVDGNQAIAGELVDQSGYSLATWVAGDDVVTLFSSLTVPELIDIARSVHEVPAQEWDAMKLEGVRNAANGQYNPYWTYNGGQSAPVSFGTDTNGDTWTIRAASATYTQRSWLSWEWDGNGAQTTTDANAQIHSVVENDRTYVLADLPRALAPTAELHVSRPGADPVVVPFNDIDPNLDRTLSAYAFVETGAFTAEIVGPDGAVLARWPSS